VSDVAAVEEQETLQIDIVDLLTDPTGSNRVLITAIDLAAVVPLQRAT
jgi:hypothetical protein